MCEQAGTPRVCVRISNWLLVFSGRFDLPSIPARGMCVCATACSRGAALADAPSNHAIMLVAAASRRCCWRRPPPARQVIGHMMQTSFPRGKDWELAGDQQIYFLAEGGQAGA